MPDDAIIDEIYISIKAETNLGVFWHECTFRFRFGINTWSTLRCASALVPRCAASPWVAEVQLLGALPSVVDLKAGNFDAWVLENVFVDAAIVTRCDACRLRIVYHLPAVEGDLLLKGVS